MLAADSSRGKMAAAAAATEATIIALHFQVCKSIPSPFDTIHRHKSYVAK